jgi:hypothetical protein
LASSSRWPQLLGGADASFNRCYAACSCSTKPRSGRTAVLPGEDIKKEKNNTADLQRSRVNITGFICTVASESSRRPTFDEFESLTIALCRARHRRRMF